MVSLNLVVSKKGKSLGNNKATWTKEQEKAINSREGDILVSAAAGSGKTAVLTRRIVDILLDEKNECFADEILVVTFTKAAASEIKNRVESSIEEILLKEPKNERLKLQKDLIKIADISTIHGFCNKLIKENFYALGISPNTKIADELEISLLKKEAIENVLNNKYEEKNNENFLKMLNIFSSEKGDERFVETINTLYDFLMSHPFPRKWLKEKIEFYKENIQTKDSIFFKIIKNHANLSLDFCILLYKDIIKSIIKDEKIKDIFFEQINLEFLEIENLKKVLNEENLEKIVEGFFSLSFSVLKRFPKDYEDDFLKEKIKNSRNTVKGIIAELKDLFNLKEEDYKEDSKKIREIITEIFNFLLDYLKEFSYLKKERSVCDFSDLEHFALKILVKETKSGFKKTKLAESLEKKYKYIMVDECQDINEIQNIIFNCVSKNSKNLFMVGDVKQSIYSFRQAMPEIFLNKKEKSVGYTPGNINATSKIILDRNFRSKKGVLEFINFIFRKILTKAVGEIDYTKEEELVCGANYENIESSEKDENSLNILINAKDGNLENKDDNNMALKILNLENRENNDSSISAKKDLEKEKNLACGVNHGNFEVNKKIKDENSYDVELKILDLKNSENKDMDLCEAGYISELIEKIINSGYKVKDKEIYREVRYSDFCILLRNANAHSKNFKDILEENGIPAKIESFKSILCAEEINTFLPLLEIIDNLYKDISLVATMLSPIFDFTLDDITFLKKSYESLPLYDCLKKSAKENNEKSLNFLEKINKYRELSKALKVSDFLNYLYEDTAYIYILNTQTGSSTKINNLKLLSNYAKNFENEKNLGFSDFLRYLNLLKESEAALKDSSFLEESFDAVKIMSIHKSKGLEFPVCILANCSRKINKDYDDVLLHPKFGIGLKLLDSKKHLKYSNLQREAVKIALLNSLISEELRILYVALTRAKQKLIILTSLKDSEKYLKNLALDLCAFPEEKLPPYFVFKAQNFSDLILASLLKCENLKFLTKDFCPRNELKSKEEIEYFSAEIVDFSGFATKNEKNKEVEDRRFKNKDFENMCSGFLDRDFSKNKECESKDSKSIEFKDRTLFESEECASDNPGDGERKRNKETESKKIETDYFNDKDNEGNISENRLFECIKLKNKEVNNEGLESLGLKDEGHWNKKVNTWTQTSKETEKRDFNNKSLNDELLAQNPLVKIDNIKNEIERLKKYKLYTSKEKIPAKLSVTKLINNDYLFLKSNREKRGELLAKNAKNIIFRDSKEEIICKSLESETLPKAKELLNKKENFKINLPSLLPDFEEESIFKNENFGTKDGVIEKQIATKTKKSGKKSVGSLPIFCGHKNKNTEEKFYQRSEWPNVTTNTEIEKVESSAKRLVSAEKGTKLHRIIKIIDFKKASESLENHLDELIENGILERESLKTIDLGIIKKFLRSNLMKRILESELVLKEFHFSVKVPYTELFNSLPLFSKNKEVLLEGVIDCAFLEDNNFVIVDYKLNCRSDFRETDKYKKQIDLYGHILNKKTNIPVKECILYSLLNGSETKI